MDDIAVGVGHAQLCELRNASAGIVHQSEENTVALIAPRRIITGIEDSSDLLPCEKTDERPGATLEGDGQKALAKSKVIGSSFGEDKMNKAFDRSQSCVARSNRIVALGFKMVEKRENDIRSERGERELISWTLEVVGEKPQHQSEGISVGGDGLRTHASLCNQMVGKESLDERGELVRVHGRIEGGNVGID